MQNATPNGFTQAYAFTLTLKPKLFTKIAEEQYDISYYHAYLSLLKLTSKVTLVAELTKNANIHYHGVIQFPINKYRNINKMFKDTYRNDKLIGFVDIKVMVDEPGWKEYLNKDIEGFKQTMLRPPVIVDTHDFFPKNTFYVNQDLEP